MTSTTARYTPAVQRLVDALNAGSHISFEYGAPKLVTPTPEQEAIDGTRCTVTRIRRDVFDRLRPYLVSRVEDPYDDYSAIIFTLPAEHAAEGDDGPDGDDTPASASSVPATRRLIGEILATGKADAPTFAVDDTVALKNGDVSNAIYSIFDIVSSGRHVLKDSVGNELGRFYRADELVLASESMPAITRNDIEALKRNWLADPCWDIEDTEGFEAHRDELKAFHDEQVARWEATRHQRLVDKAAALGVPGNLALAQCVLTLETRLEQIARDFDRHVNGE